MTTRNIHPFPARMASEIVEKRLITLKRGSLLLDPMCGSGTTVVAGRVSNVRAFGVDRDPLAVMLSSAASANLPSAELLDDASRILKRAEVLYTRLDGRSAYPLHCDLESREFLRFWFDVVARKQLLALMLALGESRCDTEIFIRIAISKMIITKGPGVSRAQDVSHSRPHRTCDIPENRPFSLLMSSVRAIISASRFSSDCTAEKATVTLGDCRTLEYYSNGVFDCVITSPPYLNAIDYLRGHKLSLVWFGYLISDIRLLRSSNVGTERGSQSHEFDWIVERMISAPECLSPRMLGVCRQYAKDLYHTMRSISRVSKFGAYVGIVIGDCEIRGVEVMNSLAVGAIAAQVGLKLTATSIREIDQSRRYLPAPQQASCNSAFVKRLWREMVLEFIVT